MRPPRHRFFASVVFLLVCAGLDSLCSAPCSAQSNESVEGTIIEVKGDFAKIDFSGVEVAKGLSAKVMRADSEKDVGEVQITYSDKEYSVGKIKSGTLSVADVVVIESKKKTARKKKKPDSKEKDADAVLPTTPISGEEFDAQILQLFKDGVLTKPVSYKKLRNLFARRFQAEFKAQIEEVTSDSEFKQWLDEHNDIKEELYTAINAKFDNVPEVLSLFQSLWKKFPDKIEEYGQLAIAVSVVWDRPRAIYDFRRHQTRAKADLPEGQMDAFENFQFLVDTEAYMQGRIKYVPWEFLKHVVNHSTSLSERQWAGANYLQKRVDFGKCYKDVPYDHEMLNSQSVTGNLNGHEYTLANIKKYGGVCAHQADFASRVGKSIGVASEYVRGENAFGSHHAWVMWIELKNATQKGISFSLESSGRYNLDKYYVGQLLEPQSGQWITDRDLELRMHTVGMDMLAKRQSDLVMQSYSTLVKSAELDCEGQVKLLGDIIKLCPGNEEAWTELSKLSTDYVAGNKRNRSKMLKLVNVMFANFENFPDFTWKLFDQMVTFEDDPDKRTGLYTQLLSTYFSAERPDLAMKARLSLTDKLVADGKPMEAIEGLAATIMAFPGEGRYVPKMLDRIDQLCETDELKALRVQFYAQLLPVVPRFRFSSPSEHCLNVYGRAISVFEEAGNTELAEATKQQKEKIKTAKKAF